MQQRFLNPAILASISGLDLVAKTVVDGFVAGLHRPPDFGFSQEFAEYCAYNCLLMTDRPLDAALREYLTLRGGRN